MQSPAISDATFVYRLGPRKCLNIRKIVHFFVWNVDTNSCDIRC